MRLLLVLSAISLLPSPIYSQVPDSLRASVHRIFGTGDFRSERFGPAKWIAGGVGYTTVEPAAGGNGVDIVRYETASGARTVMVSAAQMTPPGQSRSLDFDDYAWSPDLTKVLLFTNTQKVWRDNTRGDYWVVDRTAGSLTQLGGDGPASTMMYAKFSPDGWRVAYVRQGDIYVQDLRGGGIARLTAGANDSLVNGMTDWVYEEEFGLQDGFRWSPDGARIAYWQFDMSGVRNFLLINDTDSLYPFTIPVQYPKVGTLNSAVRLGVINSRGGPTRWVSIGGAPRDWYLPYMEWVGPNGILVQHINRRQNQNEVMLADPSSGNVQTLFTETDSAWVEDEPSVPMLDPNFRNFLWMSERDGWRHAWSVSRDGRTWNLVTPGALDVWGRPLRVDTAGGWIYFLASPTSPTERFLFRAPLAGAGGSNSPVLRVTPAGVRGMNIYNISPDAHFAFYTHSTIDTVPTTDLISLPDHRVVRRLVQNDSLRARVQPLLASRAATEFFQVPVSDGYSVDGWMIRPSNFDSTRSYPVLVYVYGEPAGQTAVNGWSTNNGLWSRVLADQGYLVVTFDNAGTPAPRGRAWRKVVYGQIGVIGSRQQAEAMRALARSRRYVDSTRVAIWGWSGGGSSTLQAMFRYPDVYQVGMAVASVPDQKLYDTIYQERYMGLLPDATQNYDRASPINFAEGLRGRLLLVHGSGDDNVHYQGDERLVNRLVALNRPFDFMVYPNRSHCICEGRGTTEHVYQLLTRYLLEHLPAGGRDARMGTR